MRTTKRVALSAIALTTALGLTACNSKDAPTATSTASSATSTPSTPESQNSSDSSSTTSESASETSQRGSEQAGEEKPTSEREDKNDKSALDASVSAIPSGPLTKAEIVKLGGYRTAGGDRGDFYSVLHVDSSGRGLVDIEYVLLDASGNEVGTVKDSISVNKGTNVIKVTRASGELPASAKKVRLKITKNAENSYATVTEVDPNMKVAQDPATKTAIVSGRYKTDGKGGNTSMTAICSDDQGVVQAATSPTKQLRTDGWNDYEVKFLMAVDNFKPTKCYVGS